MSDNVHTKVKSRLGRGLSSLLATTEPEEELEATAPTPLPPNPELQAVPAATPETAILEVAVDEIRPNPSQPRKSMDDSTIAQLAASIKATGVIQPIVVRKADDGYQLIAGERRLRAAKLAGLTTVPIVCRAVDDAQQAQMALIENIQREDLNPIERAAAYGTLVRTLGLTQAELAERMGEEREQHRQLSASPGTRAGRAGTGAGWPAVTWPCQNSGRRDRSAQARAASQADGGAGTLRSAAGTSREIWTYNPPTRFGGHPALRAFEGFGAIPDTPTRHARPSEGRVAKGAGTAGGSLHLAGSV